MFEEFKGARAAQLPFSGASFSRPIASWPVSLPQIKALLVASDLAAILVASLVTGIGYHLVVFGDSGKIGNYVSLALAQAAVLVPTLALRQAYEANALVTIRRQASLLSWHWIGTVLFLLALGFGLKISDEFSRGAVLSFAVVGLTLALGQRAALQRYVGQAVAREKIRPRRVVLVCAEERAADARSLAAHGYRLSGVVKLDYAASLAASAEGILAKVHGSDADEILLAMPWSHWFVIKGLMAELRSTPIPVRLLPDETAAEILRHPRVESGIGPSFELQRAPLSVAERAMKRALDVALASTALVVLAPLFALVALAVKLDSPGPALFQQTRKGFNGRPFRILKFRSMTVMENGHAVQQARRHDPRVTRIGAWLRRLSIDELPQLINVVRGDMSLIGPRPHAVAHDDQYVRLIANYAHRHHMKPGITGWAQVNGYRGETPRVEQMERRVDLDLWYIANWSFALDLQILARTGLALFRTKNVY